ncbi:MAG: hypothetical protein HY303_00255 [Candidatus Wallbacteria bacterium]|nr:hypothetical protein [Candidatus Wallbacteria bacterium]
MEILSFLRQVLPPQVTAAPGRPSPVLRRLAYGASTVLLCLAIALGVPAGALADSLRGQLVLLTKGGLKETPDKLVDEISDARVQAVSITNVLKSADGRIILEITFPSERKLAFEKMVAELPAVNFIVPVTVEGWNVKPTIDPIAAPEGERGESPRPGDFDMTINAKRDSISSLNFRDVPLRDVLSYLGQQMNLEYICPGEVGRRLISAQLRSVTLPQFLDGLKLGLDIGIKKIGGFYVFSARGDGVAAVKKPAAARGAEGVR